MPQSHLFGICQNNDILTLSTNETQWKEFWSGPCRKIKRLSAIPHFIWAIGCDFQVYLYVYGLDVPIIVQEEVFENQRWIPIEGFSSKLLPTDRFHYSSEDGRKNREIDSIRVPSMAWQWDSAWKIDTSLDGQQLDHDGWTYAIDFVTQFTPIKQWNSCVRRRKWVRSRRYSAMNAWCAIAPLNKDPTREPFVDVAIGGEANVDVLPGTLSVWAVTVNGRVMYRNGVSSNSPEGSRWSNIVLPNDSEAKAVSIGSNGSVWILTATGYALMRFMITKNILCGNKWLKIDPPRSDKVKLRIVQLCCGKNSVWALTDDGSVWFRQGVHGDMINLDKSMAMGTKWIEMIGRMVQISITSNDQVCALGEDNSIYFRTDVTRVNQTGKAWRKITSEIEIRKKNPVTFSDIDDMTKVSSSLNLLKKSISPKITSYSVPTTTTSLLTKFHDCSDSFETEIQLRKVCSPIYSAGSQVGIEAYPELESETDLSMLCGTDSASSQTSLNTTWLFIDAGACSIDLTHLPDWFPDTMIPEHNKYLNEEWRLQILSDLRNRTNNEFADFESAIDDRSWNQKIYCQYFFNGKTDTFTFCVLEIEYANKNGTFTILNTEGAIVQLQFFLSEIKAIIRVTSFAKYKFAMHIPHICKYEPIIFQFNSEIEMDNFMIDLNNVCNEINSVSQSLSSSLIWALTPLGDIYVSDMCLLQFDQLDGSAYKIDYDLSSQQMPIKVLLSEGCMPGSIIQLFGRIHDDNAESFTINFENSKLDCLRIVPFHFNMRFYENVIVCNHFQKEWGHEFRITNTVFHVGEAFHLKIFCEVDGFRVIMNEKKFMFFDYRLPAETICQISIHGQVDLFKISYQTPKPIISPIDLYWKRIGGHFNKIEASTIGVVWAIGYDKTIWFYDNNSEWCQNNTVTDFRDFHVYENQRWNPLTGYTSKGLPTDRPMWSDSTGSIKRTKESVKLPSSSWTWLSDWIVDFSLDNGVDEDGWQYAIDFQASYHAKNIFTDLVRRRRWIRKCKITSFGPWKELSSCKMLDISFMHVKQIENSIIVWGITVKGDVVVRDNVTKSNPMGENWIHVDSTERFMSISCGDFTNIWALGVNGLIYQRCGIDESNLFGTFWTNINSPINSKPKQIEVFANSVWLLNMNGCLYFRKNDREKTDWFIIDENVLIKHISASDYALWAVDNEGHILKRYAVTQNDPIGSGWLKGLKNCYKKHVKVENLPKMTSNEIRWVMSRKRCSASKKCCELIEATDYPLKKTSNFSLNMGLKSSGTSTPIVVKMPLKIDQLSTAMQKLNPLADDEQDPLNALMSNSDDIDYDFKNQTMSNKVIELWQIRKKKILLKFTTDEKLSIASSFFSDGDKINIKTRSISGLNWFDSLNEIEPIRLVLNISQDEYKTRIAFLNNFLNETWKAGERTKALQLVVQCSKLLSDVSVIRFYPSKFVLITDILDNFANLVYKRISDKTKQNSGHIVSTDAKETCKNWFYKIAVIRELVPRFYLECAFIKCYAFIEENCNYDRIFSRLSRSIRGISNPLVSAYARYYLSHLSCQLHDKIAQKNFLYENLFDFFISFDQLFSSKSSYRLLSNKISFTDYLELYFPAFELVIQTATFNVSDCVLETILDNYEQSTHSSFILNTIIITFPARFIANKAMLILDFIESCNDTGFASFLLLRNLGISVIQSKPDEDTLCKQIFERFWNSVRNLRAFQECLLCLEIWIEFVCLHFSNSEIEELLTYVIDKKQSISSCQTYDTNFKTIFMNVLKILKFERFLQLNNIFSFLNLIKDRNIKYELNRYILSKLSKQQELIIRDRTWANNLLRISKELHDSLTIISPDDEKKQIGVLVANFISKIAYKDDIVVTENNNDDEQQLQFYVECRQNFYNFDAVFIQLIQSVNKLAIEKLSKNYNEISSNVQSFLKACSTYCFITIPTIKCIKSKLKLYLLSAKAALLCQNYGYCEACLNSIFDLLSEIPTFNDTFFLSFVRDLLSFLLVVPDNPDDVTLCFLKKMLKFVHNYDRWETASVSKTLLLINILDLLSAFSQDSFCYHIPYVESNDTLYGLDKNFVDEINKISTLILKEILIEVKKFAEQKQLKNQTFISFELFLRIALYADLTHNDSEPLLHLATKLWKFCQKYQFNETLQLSTSQYLQHCLPASVFQI